MFTTLRSAVPSLGGKEGLSKLGLHLRRPIKVTIWLSLYIGLYFSTVTRLDMRGFRNEYVPDYQSGTIGGVESWLLTPAHWLDRHLIRPEFWKMDDILGEERMLD